MKAYKILRGILKASALTTVMFVMQACYGTPNGGYRPEMDESEEIVQDTVAQPDLQTADAECQDSQSLSE